jgi:hypothetical protein
VRSGCSEWLVRSGCNASSAAARCMVVATAARYCSTVHLYSIVVVRVAYGIGHLQVINLTANDSMVLAIDYL